MQDDALESVNQIFINYSKNYSILIDSEEISFANDYKSQSAKVALLACASYFEKRLTTEILNALNTKDCELTRSFILRKSLSRQYHTLFDWKNMSANNFFVLFGDDFKKHIKNKIKEDDVLDQSIKDFLMIGSLRNQLAHDNYATFRLNLTVEDIDKKFRSALNFVSSIQVIAREFKESR